MSETTNTRYRDYQDRADLVICRDCSSRTSLAVIPRDEIAEHDQWHTQEDEKIGGTK